MRYSWGLEPWSSKQSFHLFTFFCSCIFIVLMHSVYSEEVWLLPGWEVAQLYGESWGGFLVLWWWMQGKLVGMWLVNKGNSTSLRACPPKGWAGLPNHTWFSGRHQNIPVVWCKPNTTMLGQKKLLLFLPTVVKHRKMGKKRLSVQMTVYFNCPL